MATRKRAARSGGTRLPIAPTDQPLADRPDLPREYGLDRSKKGLLPWSHVSERMAAARCYWVCTVDAEGRPHATPVDGLWLDDRLYFGGSPLTRRQRNLACNPAACVHLESGMEVVILHGEAPAVQGVDRQLAERLSSASREKYGYGMRPEDYQAASISVFRPRKALAWNQLNEDATRWRFPASD